ncbi:MAG TPA: succinate dehydrogenase iron-sulfur subunit [Polyangia bacterium]|jgi:succinate dehydrogenase / fumarate reductase iron-sulfur subunit
MAETFRFSVFRYDGAGDAAPRFQDYDVPAQPGLTVLGGLVHIQQRIDGSLAFRSSCRAGVCGSCAMHINGRYRLACETQAADCGGTITVRPLGHLPLVRDLVVDLAPFWRAYGHIKPYLMPGTAAPAQGEYLQSADDRAKIDGIIDCILCASCHGACTTTSLSDDFLGPAALAKAARFVLDSRDGAARERLELVSGTNGVWRCHQIFSCQKVCPRSINPAGAIAELKRKAIKLRLTGRA